MHRTMRFVIVGADSPASFYCKSSSFGLRLQGLGALCSGAVDLERGLLASELLGLILESGLRDL